MKIEIDGWRGYVSAPEVRWSGFGALHVLAHPRDRFVCDPPPPFLPLSTPGFEDAAAAFVAAVADKGVEAATAAARADGFEPSDADIAAAVATPAPAPAADAPKRARRAPAATPPPADAPAADPAATAEPAPATSTAADAPTDKSSQP